MAMDIIQSTKAFLINLLNPVASHLIYTVRHGFIKGCKRKGGLDFLPKRVVPSREEIFLHGLDLHGKTVFDVGGFEGLFTLFFSGKVGAPGKVFTFEPNPVNLQKILVNARINKRGNVRVFPMAIGKERATMTMVVDPRRPASGSLNPSIKTAIKQHIPGAASSFQVKVDTIDHLVSVQKNALPIPGFVKIDVEGFEMDVLRGMSGTMRKHHPRLFIEIHGITMERKVENVRDVVGLLVDHGYQLRHVETDTSITMANHQVAAEGHIDASCT
jgi:FkbM family methyltransferase